MHPIELVFWVFFTGVALWVAWGFITVFLGWNRDRTRPASSPPRGRSGAGGAADSPESIGVITAGTAVPSLGDMGTDTGGDTGGDTGSGDSGGGGDYSGGGGESGGGGSSGGW